MSMSLTLLQSNPGEPGFYSPEMMKAFTDHIPFFKTDLATAVLPVHELKAIKYNGDLYGFLTDHKLNQDLFWMIMRLNGFHSGQDFGIGVEVILIPSRQALKKMLQRIQRT